jgi:hypothetical protein
MFCPDGEAHVDLERSSDGQWAAVVFPGGPDLQGTDMATGVRSPQLAGPRRACRRSSPFSSPRSWTSSRMMTAVDASPGSGSNLVSRIPEGRSRCVAGQDLSATAESPTNPPTTLCTPCISRCLLGLRQASHALLTLESGSCGEVVHTTRRAHKSSSTDEESQRVASLATAPFSVRLAPHRPRTA